MHYATAYFNYLAYRYIDNAMLNRKIVMDLLMMLEDRFDISIPINILLDVRTPAQLLESLIPYLENINEPV